MKKGFTLVELLVVIGILAILSLIAVTKYVDLSFNANLRVDISNAKLFSNGILYYEAIKQQKYNFVDEDTMFDDFDDIGFLGLDQHRKPLLDPINGGWYFDSIDYIVKAKVKISVDEFNKINANEQKYFIRIP